MQRHHRALAEADEREARIVEAEAGELRVEERVDRGPRGDGAAPALRRAARVVGRGAAQGEPLPAHRRSGAALGRVRRDERRLGRQRAPLLAERDQVVAVGAVAVQENHELPSGAALGIETRSGQIRRHEGLRGLLFARSSANAPRAPILLADDAGALFDAAVVGPQHARRDAA